MSHFFFELLLLLVLGVLRNGSHDLALSSAIRHWRTENPRNRPRDPPRLATMPAKCEGGALSKDFNRKYT